MTAAELVSQSFLRVRLSSNRQYYLHFNPFSDSVRTLKDELSRIEGIPSDELVLFKYAVKPQPQRTYLPDELQLTETNIERCTLVFCSRKDKATGVEEAFPQGILEGHRLGQA